MIVILIIWAILGAAAWWASTKAFTNYFKCPSYTEHLPVLPLYVITGPFGFLVTLGLILFLLKDKDE